MRDHFVTQGPRTGTITDPRSEWSAMAAVPTPAKAGASFLSCPSGAPKKPPDPRLRRRSLWKRAPLRPWKDRQPDGRGGNAALVSRLCVPRFHVVCSFLCVMRFYRASSCVQELGNGAVSSRKGRPFKGLRGIISQIFPK